MGVGEGGKDYIHKTKYEYIMKYCEGYTGDIPEKYYIENTYFKQTQLFTKNRMLKQKSI